MEDRQKTKDQLWADLEALRRRLGAWERAGTRQEFFEQALRESEARFRALVETVPLGIQECDLLGVITFANGVYHRMNGYAPGELIGKRVWDLLASEAEKTSLRLYFRHLVALQPVPTPYMAVNRAKDGRTFDVQVDWNYKRDTDGCLTGFIAVVTDVTQRKRDEEELRRARLDLERRVEERTAELEEANAELKKEIAEREQIEQALRQSEGQIRGIFESSPDCILVWDRDHICLYANRAAVDHFETTREKILGKNIRHGLAHLPDFMHLWMGRIDEVIATGRPIRVEDSGRIGGRVVHSESILSPLSNDLGEMFAVGLVYRDVTEHKRVERTVRENERRYRHIFNAVADGLFIVDRHGVITEANPAAAATYGYSQQELAGMPAEQLIHPDDRHMLKEMIKEIQVSGRAHAEVVNLRKDGSSVDVGVTSSLFNFRGLRLALSVVRDLTDRKQAERAIREEREHLRRLLEMHERDRQLAAYEIHDGFVQPLVGARMLLDTPVDVLEPPQQERHRQGIELLQRSIAEARRLISGQRPLILDEGGLLAAIEHLVCERETAQGPSIEFSHDVHFDRLARPLETALFRVVQEGLANALRHSQSERIRIAVEQGGDTVSVEIEDFGVGFDPHLVDRNRFGLEGLRERARLFGGEAAIESAPGRGTRIRVEFPVVEAPAAVDDDSQTS